jgi:hypothetical protein
METAYDELGLYRHSQFNQTTLFARIYFFWVVENFILRRKS